MTDYRGIGGNALAASPLPKDGDLFLIGVAGNWPIHADVCERHALDRIQRIPASDRSKVKVYRVAVVTLEEVEVQQEIVRAALVPKGTAVSS